MAFLIDIGTGLVGKLVDYTVVAIGRQAGYLIFYNSNVKSLEDKLSELVAENARVEQILVKENRNLKVTDDAVKNWLTGAKHLTEEVNDILDKRYKEKLMPVCGVFPNLVVRHQISRKSTKLVSDVAELYQKRIDFETYAHEIDPQDVPSRDYEALSSRTKVVDDIMDYFRNNPDDNLIGVFGLGGIGKTTLVKEVARQATQDKSMFNDVALVLDVKQDPDNIQRIQKEIAEKLDLKFSEDESPAGRARRIFTRIKDNKTLVILDDVWGKIDLEAVGISGVAACKVLLTSRYRRVLLDMQTQKQFPLDILKEEEAWNLFKKKAGDVVEVPPIKAVATEVAKKCGGLPVLVVTVASALRDNSKLLAWKDARTRLKRFGKEEETKKIFLTLQWSYRQLKSEELKQVFLLCGLLANSLKIFCISDVFKYAIGLGFFKNHKNLGEAWAAVNTLLEKLKDSCLLLDHEDSRCLKMHDVVYDVANRISSRDHHMLKILDGDEFKEWPDNKCTMVSLITSNIPKLPQVLSCKKLKLFHMHTQDQQRYPLDVPRDFFNETGKLGVLDLTGLSMLSLPSSIQFLKNLKTLCLDYCILGDIALIGQLQQLEVLSFGYSMFKELPKEVGELTHLRSLDLTSCFELEIIAPGVISNLKMLEELKMGNSFNKWEADGEGIINNEKSNASLSELKCLSKLSVLHIHILNANLLPRDLFSNALERFQIYIGADWQWDHVADENVNILKIKLTTSAQVYRSGIKTLLKRTDELHLDGMEAGSNAAHQLDGDQFQQLKYLHVHNSEFRNTINGEGVFLNLQRLEVSGLDSSKFLLSASEARRLVQLTHLEISECPTMEEIVSMNESDEIHMMDIFSKLQHLELEDLPRLTKFCSRIGTGYQSLEILLSENNEIVQVMKSGADIQNSFFNEKVVFPSMKTLIINGLTKLISVWHHQLSPKSFKRIETVEISHCPSLETVFPISMVTSLKNLLHLKVEECGVEQIIADGIETTYEFVFPKVVSFRLWDLPNLNGFYNKMHVSLWPSLQELYVTDCSKVAFLAQECSNSQRNYESRNPAPTNQALFSITKDSFPNLKSVIMYGMEFMDSDFPSIYYTNLEDFTFGYSNAESAAIFDNSTGLQNYGETSAPAPSEINSHAERRIDEIPSVGTLTHLSQLYLIRLPCLMHLGNGSSQGIAGQNIPNLKYLWIYGCDSLRNLRSSAVSFKNLTELEVDHCWGLEYMITFSTAKRLNQLTNLSVDNCARLVEIVRITEEDENAENEIVFSRLKYLRLSNLPRLQTFCSKDCIVEFPSLEKLSISKRLKSKIFHHDETLQITEENADTDVDGDDAKAGVQADDGETMIQVTKEDVDLDANVNGEQSDITTKIITEQDNVQPLQITATDQDVIALIEENMIILPVTQVTTHVFPAIEPSLVTQVTHDDELLVEQFFSDIESVAEETTISDLHETPDPSTPVQHIKEQSDSSKPSSVATRSSMKSFGEKWSLIVVLLAVLLGICIPLISLPYLRPGSRICTSVPLCHVINPFFHHLTSHQKHVHEPLEIETDQGLITPVEENLDVALEGQKRITRVLLDIECPPVAEVPQTEASSPDDEKQSNLYERSASTSSRKYEAKRSLREKLQAMSAKRTSSSSGPYEEAKSKLKDLIATADLKDPHTRQQLLEILPALQISTTKWIADLAVQELAKLQLVMDKKQSLSAELAAHISQGSELDMRSQKLLSEGSAAEKNIHKVEEHKAELLALREQIKKLEAQATSLEEEITVLENKHFGFEASLDELDEEHQVNQGYVESTSQELLRTQAESASLSTAIDHNFSLIRVHVFLLSRMIICKNYVQHLIQTCLCIKEIYLFQHSIYVQLFRIIIKYQIPKLQVNF